MNMLLSHLGLEPLLYGILIFLGLVVWAIKVQAQMWFSLAIDLGVFWLVFSLHGGTMTGGMAATVAALLSGIFLPLFIRK